MNIQSYIQESIDTKSKILKNDNLLNKIRTIVDIIVKAYSENKKVLTAGNGGSAADAQHLAGELVSKLNFDRPALNALSLVMNTSVLTAVGNDYDFNQCFARQIQANAQKGDIFIAISTSGNSDNIIYALEEAQRKGVINIGLTGAKKCRMDDLCDYIIHVPSEHTPNIQESHIMLAHIICALVEEKIYGKN